MERRQHPADRSDRVGNVDIGVHSPPRTDRPTNEIEKTNWAVPSSKT